MATGLLLPLVAFTTVPLLRATGIHSSVSRSRLSVATVERGRFVRDFAADGRIVAANSPVLYAPGPGTVQLHARPGDAVTKGQILAVIDSPELHARLSLELAGLDAQVADLQRARVELARAAAEAQQVHEQAEVDFKTTQREAVRSRSAFEYGAYSRSQMERAEDEMEKARFALTHAARNLAVQPEQQQFEIASREATVRRQQLLVDELQRQVEALHLRSPVDGQVGQVQVSDRATVPRDAPLMSVVDLSQLEVEIEVPESFARELAPGIAAELSGGGGKWTGRLHGVSPEVVDGQVVATVRFEGEPPPGLRQNQRLAVRVLIEQREDVLTVERGALAENSAGHVYRLEGDVALRVPVRLGSASIGRVQVLDGLAAGDRVVVSGMDALREAESVLLSR